MLAAKRQHVMGAGVQFVDQQQPPTGVLGGRELAAMGEQRRFEQQHVGIVLDSQAAPAADLSERLGETFAAQADRARGARSQRGASAGRPARRGNRGGDERRTRSVACADRVDPGRRLMRRVGGAAEIDFGPATASPAGRPFAVSCGW